MLFIVGTRLIYRLWRFRSDIVPLLRGPPPSMIKFLVLKPEKLVKECKGLTIVLDIICIYVVAEVRYREIRF